MPLEVTVDPGATVYADADAIDEIAELRVGGSAWLALTSDQKDQAAATATADIDSLENDDSVDEDNPGFLGVRTNPEQELAWPRTGTSFSDDAWPTNLVRAAAELAISYAPAIVAGRDVLNPDLNAGNLKRKKTGALESEWFAPRATTATALARLPAQVQRLLAPLMNIVSSSVFGTGTARRSS